MIGGVQFKAVNANYKHEILKLVEAEIFNQLGKLLKVKLCRSKAAEGKNCSALSKAN